jgi:hypothetical protein
LALLGVFRTLADYLRKKAILVTIVVLIVAELFGVLWSFWPERVYGYIRGLRRAASCCFIQETVLQAGSST